MKMRPGAQTGFLLCGKEWVDGEAIEVRSPWDQGLLGKVTVATRKDAREAVNHAVASMRRLRALPRWKRKEILEDIAAALIEQKERFAQLIVAEAGKPIRTARVEVERAILTFKTAAEDVIRLGGESIPLDLTEGNEGRWGLVQRFARGPVLAITPFNFPLMLVAHKLAPAIACGCPVILKPAPQTPFTALALGEVVLKAGWPEEALAILPLANEDTAWLAEREDRLKLVSFTGSAAVGWTLKAKSGKKRVALELGGNAALIVHSDWAGGDDAVLDAAAMRTAHGAFGYAGQSCISVQRVYVHRPIFQSFLWKVVERANKMVCGDPANETTEVGPVIRPADAERVEAWVKEAVEAGAKIVESSAREGSVLAPTILTGTRPGMKVHDEEIFGPVVAIEPYDDFEEALAMVNHSRYGLQTGLYTRDAGRIMTAFRELEVGAVIVGDTPTWRLDPMPYGGVKDSGLGREGIRWAIEEMTEPRMLVMAGV
ncbi:aldehyde dehydrogenase family protein [Acidicapsa dinghuensis]|uniref:Aldehyde dehydrogenase family protein n=1 Tax=Acidicapsa dinghuensis TaxID=2218256 RepID=A0ABW1EJL6_9BACT|nr:aldehyde dehydrogenase family protein [Acidicapsa dinghuensis]